MEDVLATLRDNYVTGVGSEGTFQRLADAIAALYVNQPTVTEVKRQTLDELWRLHADGDCGANPVCDCSEWPCRFATLFHRFAKELAP